MQVPVELAVIVALHHRLRTSHHGSLVHAVRERVVTRLNALSLSFHQREGVGGTMNRTTFVGRGNGVRFDWLALYFVATSTTRRAIAGPWRSGG